MRWIFVLMSDLTSSHQSICSFSVCSHCLHAFEDGSCHQNGRCVQQTDVLSPSRNERHPDSKSVAQEATDSEGTVLHLRLHHHLTMKKWQWWMNYWQNIKVTIIAQLLDAYKFCEVFNGSWDCRPLSSSANKQCAMHIPDNSFIMWTHKNCWVNYT